MEKIKVDGHEINIISKNDDDYICLTDMVSSTEEGSKLIEKWLTNKNTIEYLGVWEQLNNPDFNSPEFGGIRNEAGTNRFFMSVKQWITKTNAIGIVARTGRYGGTYAHKDIAFQFGMYISPMFNLLLVKEFQRLKDEEQNRLSGEWDFRRFLSKANYKIHTDAIRDNLIPISNLPKEKEGVVYANEAEILNFALFGMTSKTWKEKNPELTLKGLNIRDCADAHELIVLSNLESANASMIKKGVDKKRRLEVLRDKAESELKSLRSSTYTIDKIKSPYLPKTTDDTKQLGDFDKTVKRFLDTPPPKKE